MKATWSGKRNHINKKKSRDGDPLGPIKLIGWPEQGKYFDQGDKRKESDQQGDEGNLTSVIRVNRLTSVIRVIRVIRMIKMRVAWVTGVTGLTKVIGVARVTSMNKELIFSLICLVFRVGTRGPPSLTRHPPQKNYIFWSGANMFSHIQIYWKSKIPLQQVTPGTLSVKGQHRNGAFRKKTHTNRSRFCRQDFQRVSWFFLLRINKHCLWNFSLWRHKQAKR